MYMVIYIYIWLYIYMVLYFYGYMFIWLYMYICRYSRTHIHMCICISFYIQLYIDFYTAINIHIYIYYKYILYTYIRYIHNIYIYIKYIYIYDLGYLHLRICRPKSALDGGITCRSRPNKVTPLPLERTPCRWPACFVFSWDDDLEMGIYGQTQTMDDNKVIQGETVAKMGMGQYL